MIEIVDKIDVSCIKQEIQSCDPSAWFDNLAWSAPIEVADSNIGSYSKKINSSVIREQDRILLIWHKDQNGKAWYLHSDYRSFETAPTSRSQMFPETMKFLLDYFAQKQQRMVRLYFSRLRPGKQIYPHTDEKFQPHDADFSTVKRYGLAVTTNPQCRVSCDNFDLHLESGTLYFLDNMKIHAATNFGSVDRVHMYMDIVPI